MDVEIVKWLFIEVQYIYKDMCNPTGRVILQRFFIHIALFSYHNIIISSQNTDEIQKALFEC